MQGENLRAAVVNFGLQDSVLFPDQYSIIANLLSQNYLNDIYNASDTFMLLSSEGFGIPAVEAQMAGCPAVLLDYAALSQLSFGGELVTAQPFYLPQLQVWWGRPVILEAARALNRMYQKQDNQPRIKSYESNKQ
jgi:glycosyltransferase involved in cell wall biosynthesis